MRPQQRALADGGEGSDRGENSWGNETWGWNNRASAYTTTDGVTKSFSGGISEGMNDSLMAMPTLASEHNLPFTPIEIRAPFD